MKSKSRAIAFATAATFALLGASANSDDADTVDGLAAVHERGVLEVALYADFPPYSSGTPADAKGIDVDIARAIAQKLGVKLRLRLIPAGESVTDDLRNHIWKGHYLGGGVADVMLHVGYDPVYAQREKNAVLFAPYFHETVVIAYKPEKIKNIESPIALTEHKIAVEGDTISDHILSSAYGGALRNSAMREQSLQEAVEAYKSGEADAIMGPIGEVEGLLTAQHVTDVAYHTQQAIGMMRTAWDIAVAVKDTGSPALRDAVAKAIGSLKDDGSIKTIFANYGVQYTDAATSGSAKLSVGDPHHIKP